MSHLHRFAAVLGALLVIGLTDPSIAAADPAGPTDYRSEITAVDPADDGIALRMIGGDSFLELAVTPGVDVVVIGYRGEPYLWFAPNGTVYENERSPSRYLNEDRFGEQEIPSIADAEADPVWIEIGADGHFAWHDHRTHWMNRARPPGAEPGDTILEAVVPLVVDGESVSVTVQSVWQDAPSPIGALLGGLAAVVAIGVLVRQVGRTRAAALTGSLIALLALGVGVWQFSSLPTETGPTPMLWILPLLALVCASFAILSLRNQGWDDPISGLIMLTGLVMALWGWLRIDGVSAAIIPTDAPYALDRAVTVAAIVIGLAAVALAGLDMGLRISRRPATASSAQH